MGALRARLSKMVGRSGQPAVDTRWWHWDGNAWQPPEGWVWDVDRWVAPGTSAQMVRRPVPLAASRPAPEPSNIDSILKDLVRAS